MSKNPEDERRESREATGEQLLSICAHDRWITSVNGVDDGDVEIRDVAGNKLEGTHRNSGDAITGHCTEGVPHVIHLERTDKTGTLHTYDGVVARIFLPRLGIVPITVIVGTHKPSTKLDGDDEWTGGHTT